MTIYSILRYPIGYYVYAYLRADGTPYYIGKGVRYRAWANHRINNKGVHTPKQMSRIKILESNLSECGGLALERRYIRWYGRKDLTYSDRPPGILHNKTDGGEGPGVPHKSTKWREKHNARMTGDNNPSKNNSSFSYSQSRMMKNNNPMKNKDTLLKRSESISCSKHFTKQPGYIPRTIQCPYCNIITSITMNVRWHGEKCKFKEQSCFS